MIKISLSAQDKKDFNILSGTILYNIAFLNCSYYKLLSEKKESLISDDFLSLIDMNTYYLYISPEMEKNDFLYLQLRDSGFNIGINKKCVECTRIERRRVPVALKQGTNSVSLNFDKKERSFYFYNKKEEIPKNYKTGGLLRDNNIVLDEKDYLLTWFLIKKVYFNMENIYGPK